MRIPLSLFVLLTVSGCSLGFDYHQCNTNEDCLAYADQPFCTGEGFCINEPTPTYLCAEQYPQTTPQNAIPIGVLFRLAEGQPSRTRLLAVQLGIDEVNDQSRFNRSIRPIVAYICDTSKARADERRANDLESMLTYLVNEKKVYGIIGPANNDDAKAVLPASVSRQIPFLSPAADGSNLGDAQNQGFFFRTVPADSMQAQTLAQSAKDFPNNAAAPNAVYLTMASVQSDYGESLRQTFQDKWDDRNQANVPSATPTFPESLEAKEKVVAVATNILTSDPEPTHVLVIVSRAAQPHVLTLFEQLKDLKSFTTNATDAKIYVSDGAVAPELLPLALDPAYAKLVQNLQGISPVSLDRSATSRQTTNEFIANMKAQKGLTIEPETGSYDPYISFTYDAFYALAMAAESVRGTDAPGPQVAQALRRIKSNSTAKQFAIGPGSFGAFVVGVTTLQAGGEVGLSGVTGAVRFAAGGNREPALYERWKLEKVAPTTPEAMPTAKFTFSTF